MNRKTLGRTTSALVVVTAVSLVATGCLAAPGSGPKSDDGDGTRTKITVGAPSIMGPNNSPIAVAQGLGYFADEGLDVDFIATGGSAESVQATLSGQIQIGSSTSEPIYQLEERAKSGEDVVMVYNYLRAPTGSIAVLEDSPIASVDDLAGTVIGADSLGSGNVLLAEGILSLGGVDPADVTFVSTGTGAPALQALTSGQVDALSLWDTEYAAIEAAGHPLRYFLDPGVEDLFSTTFFVTPDYAKDNADVIEGFGRALAKATLFTATNPEAALQVMYEQYTDTRLPGTTLEEQLAKDSISLKARIERLTAGDPAGTGTFGEYPEGAVDNWIAFAVNAGIIDAKIDGSGLFTNDFVAAYNDFDHDAVIAQAEKWTP